MKNPLKEVLILAPLIAVAVVAINLGQEEGLPRQTTLCQLEGSSGDVRWTGTVVDTVDTMSSISVSLSSGECETTVFVPSRYRSLVEIGQRPRFLGHVDGGEVRVLSVEAGEFNLEGELQMDYITVEIGRVPQELMLGYRGRHRDGYEWWGVLETPAPQRDQMEPGGVYRLYYREGVVERVVRVR